MKNSLLPRLRIPDHHECISGVNFPALKCYLAERRFSNPDLRQLLVLPTQREALEVQRDLESLGIEVLMLPFWETIAYEALSVYAPVFGQRATVLHRFAVERPLLIAPIQSFLYAVPDRSQAASLAFSIDVGQTVDPQLLAEKLVGWGYARVPRVSLRGEFALRGEVVDIYSCGSEYPLRATLDYDEVRALRFFDPITQRSIEELNTSRVFCSREMPSSQAAPRFSKEWQAIFRGEAPGAEYLFPLLSDRSALGDYLDESDTLIYYDVPRLEEEERRLHSDFNQRYRQSHTTLPAPSKLLHSLDTSRNADLRVYAEDHDDMPIWRSREAEHFAGNVKLCKKKLDELDKAGYRVMITAAGELQAERLSHLLDGRSVAPIRLSRGLVLPDEKFALYTDRDILGYKKAAAPVSLHVAKSRKLSSLSELAEGAYVVHINHGIGRFKGIRRMKTGGSERDYIFLGYAEDEHLFVPIEQMNLVQRYVGEESPRLDTLGGSSWKRRKERVKKNLEELAEKLIRLYAHRETIKGHAFASDTEWQEQFESLFPYEETADQIRSVEEIKTDMEKPTPMDRLLCGDVGFGKTEVALRAVFKAVMDGRQVAFLAPTTILVEQHYERIQERMQNFPIKSAMLSRFVPKAEQKRVLRALQNGSVDIVVGTHRLLQKDVSFKLLGLIVVDEEQRFGVSAKERLKELRSSVDCLMLSATPIPRTLHMSLLNIRNMSVLQEPPHNRKPIHTVVKAFHADEVAAAIRKEIGRGGQVYYLHNRIESLDAIVDFIASLVPEASSAIAHGQMHARELEETMYRFIHGAFNVLIATTIIENGLDIPNVNTIIIDRADHYGIAQLYQLRGRVGRSDRLAYAYLFYPEKNYLSEIAQRRLEVIRDHTELGSGFQVAIRDMELRGVGNLLGREQSGSACAVGLELYLTLLESSIRSLTTQEAGEEEISLELEYRGFIPDDYIAEPMLKMGLYKRIAGIEDEASREALIKDTEDRFGPMPEEVQNLFTISRMHILCAELGAESLKERGDTVRVSFAARNAVSPEKVVSLLQEEGSGLRMGQDIRELVIDTSKIATEKKARYLSELFARLRQ